MDPWCVVMERRGRRMSMRRWARSGLHVSLFLSASLSLGFGCQISPDTWYGKSGIGQGGAGDGGGNGTGLPFGSGSTGGATPSCSDGKKNGSESDVDCGGVCGACKGESCGNGKDCATGYCVDGVCCDSACNETCKACNLPASKGICSDMPLYTKDSSPADACTGSKTCDGAGRCLGDIFTACATDDDCASSSCRTLILGQGICTRKSGEACKHNEECATNKCLQDVCTECTTVLDCGQNRACIDTGKPACYETCASPSNACSSGFLCLSSTVGGYCAPSCSPQNPCPQGQHCINYFCVPDAP